MDAWRSIAAAIGHWTLRGFGVWAVERKSDHTFIGHSGLFQPEGWPGMEVVWTLNRPYWGQGYATEAAKASLGYGFQNFPVPKLISLIDPDNHASRRVAERLGETKGGSTTITLFGQSYDVDVWEISRGDWSTNQG
jgi:RimJ/RimL family protein N-acetyltransferase